MLSLSQIVVSLVSVFSSVCFVYIFSQGLRAIFLRGIQCLFTSDELICLSVLCISFFCGLANIFVFGVNISVSIVLFLILCVSRCFSKTVTMCFASLSGIGFAFHSSSLVFEAVFVCFAIVSCLLSENNRVVVSFAVLIVDVFFGCFFNVYSVYNFYSLFPLLVVTLIFIFIPTKFFMMIKNFSFAYEGSLLQQYLIFGERESVKKRIHETQMIFKKMENEYRFLSLASAEKEQACEMLCDDLMQKLCEKCLNKNKCREKTQIKESITKLFMFGIEKEKVTILDASNILSEHCGSLSSLILEVNARLKTYFEFEKTVCQNNKERMIVSSQLGATAEIFHELEENSFKERKIDKKRSRAVSDELLKRNVIVNESVVLTNDDGVSKVVLVVRNKDVCSKEILLSLKKIFKIEFSAQEQKMSRYSGWSILSFVPSQKYDLTIGYASSSKDKSGVSGDTSAILKIDQNRYLFAISDGMGHGEKANKIATTTLSLVENFYKSGFSSSTIVSSVNKLLLSREDEQFVTLDACVVDLSEGVADFVKVGASVSVIKSHNQCKMVFADSLPLGTFNISSPQIQTVVLKEKDIVILASDGIVDSFDAVEDFVSYVNNQDILNVQMLAEDILEEAESRTKHKDDMTVIVLKISQAKISA